MCLREQKKVKIKTKMASGLSIPPAIEDTTGRPIELISGALSWIWSTELFVQNFVLIG